MQETVSESILHQKTATTAVPERGVVLGLSCDLHTTKDAGLHWQQTVGTRPWRKHDTLVRHLVLASIQQIMVMVMDNVGPTAAGVEDASPYSLQLVRTSTYLEVGKYSTDYANTTATSKQF